MFLAPLWFNSAAISLSSTRKFIPLRATIEIAVIVIFLLVITPRQQDMSVDKRIHGAEFSYLINSGVIAANVYHKTGSIPVWNPFMGRGEPLIESPFSFVLNPLMTLPIFAFGLHPGTKVAVLLHIVLMGVGGWTLAYTLGLGTAGRLFLGCILGCSGSLAGSISEGFYQMALSQAYVPFVYAGLIGTLYGDKRWPVGVLVVSASLLMFAGTFWYVLPTALVCGLITLFALIQNQHIQWMRVKRLMLAAVLTLMVSAVRLVPVVINSDYVGEHPREMLDQGTQDFWKMSQLLVDPILAEQFPNNALYYHYTLPVVFIVVISIVWLSLALNDRLPDMPHRWRVLIPAGMMMLVFIVWAQEDTPMLRWLYTTFTFLSEWRLLGRMLAAASPLLIMIMAVLFYDVVYGLWFRVSIAKTQVFGTIAVCLFGLWTVTEMGTNWNRLPAMQEINNFTAPSTHYLRLVHSEPMLSVYTFSFYEYLPFYERWVRAAYGNPDYKPGVLASTVGDPFHFDYMPQYALVWDDVTGLFMEQNGYLQLPQFPLDIVYNPQSPGYAFTFPTAMLGSEIQRWNVNPVAYSHAIDEVYIRLTDYRAGDVLVITENAYPGWIVRVNGETVATESVGGLVGVILPVGTEPLDIVFAYQPKALYLGGFITVIGVMTVSIYLLSPQLRQARLLFARLFRRGAPPQSPRHDAPLPAS